MSGMKYCRVDILRNQRDARSPAQYNHLDKDNLMSLRWMGYQRIDHMINYHYKKHLELEAEYLKLFRDTYGQQVRVVRGRKVPIGTTGECFWMGLKTYLYGRLHVSQAREHLRIGLKTSAGEVYWTDLQNVEVVQVRDPMKDFLEQYCDKYFEDAPIELPSLYNLEETADMVKMREVIESLHEKYTFCRHQVACTKRLLDEEESAETYDLHDAAWRKCQAIQEAIQVAINWYGVYWNRDIRPFI